MNYAIILAGGSGQRMRKNGTPKQFLNVYGKPIIIYTLEQFQENPLIDQIIIPCNQDWICHMGDLVKKHSIDKVTKIVTGGRNRCESIQMGVDAISVPLTDDDIVVIHDGVRPLIRQDTISKNVEVAKSFGNAMTVRANVETVIVTEANAVDWTNFMNREHTYTLTAPQSFRGKELMGALKKLSELSENSDLPLLDISLLYAKLGKQVFLVIEDGNNLKITTPEDYFYLKSYLEFQESKNILGV